MSRYNEASDPRIPGGHLAELIRDSEYARADIGWDPEIPDRMWINLVVLDDKYRVAISPSMSSELLSELALIGDCEVRSEVAANPNTPVELLTKLAGDEDEDVRYYVAENPNTPTSTLTLLTTDREEYVAQAAQEQLATRPQSTVSWMMGGGL